MIIIDIIPIIYYRKNESLYTMLCPEIYQLNVFLITLAVIFTGA